MAIHPNYAEAILTGRKLVEFRKRALAADISSVLIYATSPVQRVIGEFVIERILAASPEEVWQRFGDVGCIDRADFDDYYASSKVAVAIEIKSFRQFDKPLPLSSLSPQPSIPQSFVYLDESTLCGPAYSEGRTQVELLDRSTVLTGV
jgi:predicted transcriptional regulator